MTHRLTSEAIIELLDRNQIDDLISKICSKYRIYQWILIEEDLVNDDCRHVIGSYLCLEDSLNIIIDKVKQIIDKNRDEYKKLFYTELDTFSTKFVDSEDELKALIIDMNCFWTDGIIMYNIEQVKIS